jgi:hypothetical protein
LTLSATARSWLSLIFREIKRGWKMDFSEVCYAVTASHLLCYPCNQEHLEAHLPEVLPEFIEQLAPKLPLHICCRAGFYQIGSAVVDDIEVTESSETEIRGSATMDFDEEDPSHFTDGPRRARLHFSFECDTALLQIRCEPPGAD